ncbi:hypothetical protein CLV72_11114 [Allonocardiopsis opalescens]|uniref:Uncharacterized protein n=1 Tax=Allonocardiopsis opalescens TaxID=1144618 RepID=A0A2T0PTA1_9ACTN|nr:hypothetical protein CLV72_11114 [Allonocardiopsis opalescens]
MLIYAFQLPYIGVFALLDWLRVLRGGDPQLLKSLFASFDTGHWIQSAISLIIGVTALAVWWAKRPRSPHAASPPNRSSAPDSAGNDRSEDPRP